MGVGGGSQSQNSNSAGFNQSFGSAMNLAQEQQYNNLWGNAGNLANQNAGQAQGYAGLNQANAYNQQAAGALGGQNMNQAFGTLNRMQNPGTDPMMGAYADQIGQQFNRTIMPGIQGQAIMGGGMGGSRQGIAQGLAASDAQKNIQNFGAQLYGQNQDRALNAANMGGNLANAQGQGYGALGQSALANGQFGMSIPWYAQQQYAGLLGGPVMEDLGGVSSNDATGSGRGSNFNAHIW